MRDGPSRNLGGACEPIASRLRGLYSWRAALGSALAVSFALAAAPAWTGETTPPAAPAAAQGEGSVRVDAGPALAPLQPGKLYAAPPSVAPVQPDPAAAQQWGFAARGGLKVNLPNLSDADAMILQATYARGAAAARSDAAISQPLFAGFADPLHPAGFVNPPVVQGMAHYDFACGQSGDARNCAPPQGYALAAAIRQIWTPTVSSSLFSSFLAPPPAAASNEPSATPTRNLIGGGAPVAPPDLAAKPAQPAPSDPPAPLNGPPEWSGRIRLQHNF